MKTLRLSAILAMVAALSFGCSDNDEDNLGAAGASHSGAAGEGSGQGEGGATSGATPLELIGEYSDNFDGTQTITAESWNGSAIVGYDNDANVVYTQFPADDEFNPSKFAKTVYTDLKSGSFYFCMVEFSLDSLADVEASKATADDSDPETTGCGGDFPWTKATAK